MIHLNLYKRTVSKPSISHFFCVAASAGGLNAAVVVVVFAIIECCVYVYVQCTQQEFKVLSTEAVLYIRLSTHKYV